MVEHSTVIQYCPALPRNKGSRYWLCDDRVEEIEKDSRRPWSPADLVKLCGVYMVSTPILRGPANA